MVAGALEQGWHVMVEKPLGVSVAACRYIRQRADRSGLVVSVAENYRRDPLNRLARALIDAGAIGAPRFYLHNSLGGSDVMFITVWRHRKEQGGLLVDAGVHDTDMMEYLCGPVAEVYAQARLHEPERANPARAAGGGAVNPAGVYERWQRQMPERFAADAEDALYATLRFANGAAGQYVADHAARGLPQWRRALYGSAGAVELPPDRLESLLRLSGAVSGTAAQSCWNWRRSIIWRRRPRACSAASGWPATNWSSRPSTAS